MTSPYEYPLAPLVRRHGPRGYRQPGLYSPWLRDEFTFRCVYCLTRETWQLQDLEVEHFVASSLKPELSLEYDNLLYACRTCNSSKGTQTIPDPCVAFIRGSVSVQSDGTLIATTREAEDIIDALVLNADRYREMRRLWIRIVEMAKDNDPDLYRQLVGYPTHLPDLSILRPPGGNIKPEGIESSYRTRRLRGELAEMY